MKKLSEEEEREKKRKNINREICNNYGKKEDIKELLFHEDNLDNLENIKDEIKNIFIREESKSNPVSNDKANLKCKPLRVLLTKIIKLLEKEENFEVIKGIFEMIIEQEVAEKYTPDSNIIEVCNEEIKIQPTINLKSFNELLNLKIEDEITIEQIDDGTLNELNINTILSSENEYKLALKTLEDKLKELGKEKEEDKDTQKIAQLSILYVKINELYKSFLINNIEDSLLKEQLTKNNETIKTLFKNLKNKEKTKKIKTKNNDQLILNGMVIILLKKFDKKIEKLIPELNDFMIRDEQIMDIVSKINKIYEKPGEPHDFQFGGMFKRDKRDKLKEAANKHLDFFTKDEKKIIVDLTYKYRGNNIDWVEYDYKDLYYKVRTECKNIKSKFKDMNIESIKKEKRWSRGAILISGVASSILFYLFFIGAAVSVYGVPAILGLALWWNLHQTNILEKKIMKDIYDKYFVHVPKIMNLSTDTHFTSISNAEMKLMDGKQLSVAITNQYITENLEKFNEIKKNKPNKFNELIHKMEKNEKLDSLEKDIVQVKFNIEIYYFWYMSLFFKKAYEILKEQNTNKSKRARSKGGGKRKSSKRNAKRNSNKKTRKVAKHKKRHSKNSAATQKKRRRRKISRRNKSKGGKYKKKRSKKNRK